MEFIKTLQDAMTLGLTKEEFIDIWKIESQFKLAMQGKNQTSQEAAREDKHQVKHCDSEGCVADPNLLKSLLDLQREECKQELDVHFHSMCKELVNQQEHHWQQMHLRSDKVFEDIRYHLGCLSNHISNTADSNASSLKLYFMQEIELLKQDLRKVIMEDAVTNRSNTVLSNLSRQQSHVSDVQVSTAQEDAVTNRSNTVLSTLPRQQSHVSDVQVSTAEAKISDHDESQCAGSVHDNHNNSLCQSFHKNMQTLQPQKQHSLSQLTFESETEDRLGTTQMMKEIEVHTLAQLPGTNLSTDVKVESDLDVVTLEELVKDHTGTREANRLKDRATGFKHLFKMGSLLPVKDAPEMHHKTTEYWVTEPNESSPFSSKLRGSVENLLALSDASLSEGCQEFTIIIHENDRELFSPFFYSEGKACRCRIRINIEPTGVLSFYVIVSKGAHDDDFTWPVQISGNGLVFNTGSKRFTQIWLMPSALFRKPFMEEEFHFKCEVCLSTSRSKHSEVTYETLLLKNYAENQRFTFKTILNGVEIYKLLP